MSSIKIVLYSPEKHKHYIPSIVDLHVQCIEFDGALLRFHPPFTSTKREKMRTFWEERLQQNMARRRITLLAFSSAPNRDLSTVPSPDDPTSAQGSIVGLVELGLPEAETGPFRADVEMLMVSPHHRKEGIGKKLMHELERISLEEQRTLLQLSTTAGSAAEQYMYPRLGYLKFGVVPNYGICPTTGRLVDGVYFYKQLKAV